ncbi:MAG: response regulator [Ignavibacteriota bacterium]
MFENGTANDVSYRNSEACLQVTRKSHASWQRVQRMASLGSWELDCRTGIVEWSAEMYSIFGLPPEDCPPTQERLLETIHPNDQQKVVDALRELLQNGVPYCVDFSIIRPDGSKRHVRERAELETGEDGDVRLVGVMQDVTEYQHLEEQFQTAQKLESVGRLAGGVAHDFNNLLTVINGYTGLLLRKAGEDTTTRTGLEEIRKAGEKAAMLTQQLLAFSRKQVVRPEVLDLNAVVGEMHHMLRRLIGEQIRLNTILESGAAQVKADPGHLHQIVMNLAVNARDAMPEGGQLLIETAHIDVPETGADRDPNLAPGQYVLLAVTDTGAGMDEETRTHIFEPFFTTKEVGRGAGLGMSTVYGIVQQCGGSIWVESELGRGTTVKVYLPRLHSETVVRPAEAHPVMASGFETVLVVEDQEEVRRLTVAVLEDCGYQVLSAENGPMALEVSEQHQGLIHLLVTDAIMPGMSGRQLADRLRHTRPLTKVLFMSGYTDNVAAYRFEVDAGHAFLQKPFDPDSLAEKVRETLGPPHAVARILVVDDEESVRSLLRNMLTEAGHEVLEASNGREATERLRAEAVDLMVTDLVMPEREGIETIMELHRTRPELGIIAMSGAFGGQFLRAARLFGARATLTKPIDPDVLLAEVDGFLLERANLGEPQQ